MRHCMVMGQTKAISMFLIWSAEFKDKLLSPSYLIYYCLKCIIGNRVNSRKHGLISKFTRR